jgi:predicted outer membrane lipoprotein
MKRVHMSARARRVLYPALAVVFVTFFSFLTHLLLLGTSAFPAGRIVAGRYLVEDHGRVIELTARQYWFSYIHGVLLVAVFAIVAALLMFFYSRGDLRDEHTTA